MEQREDSIYGEEIEKLDLRKYGLEYLEGRNILTLDRPDLGRLLEALGNDDISLNVPIACTEQNVRDLLALSECRRCGRCCKPNPLNPKSPGIEIFEEELQAIARTVGQPYEDIRKKTTVGHSVPYAFQMVKLGFTRWLPLPCPFYSEERGGCEVYAARGVVCMVYPVIFTGDDTYMSIRVTCDYGKDVVMEAYKRVLRDDPKAEIIL
jgi:Fe-S-cluster containining protein